MIKAVVDKRKRHFIKRMKERYEIEVDKEYIHIINNQITKHKCIMVHSLTLTKLLAMIEVKSMVLLIVYSLKHNVPITALPIDRDSMGPFLNIFRCK